MNRVTYSRFALACCLVAAAAVSAAEPLPAPPGAAAQQPDFSPPPVPEFMLRKPAQPLTLEEMQKQADEAARRARADRDRQAEPPRPGAQAGGAGGK